jgi:hypothetical protein
MYIWKLNVREGFVVDTAAMEDNAATLYWNWDMNLNNQVQTGLNGRFRGFKVGFDIPLTM